MQAPLPAGGCQSSVPISMPILVDGTCTELTYAPWYECRLVEDQVGVSGESFGNPLIWPREVAFV